MIMSKRRAYCSVCGCAVPHDAESKSCPHCHTEYKSKPQIVEAASNLHERDYLCVATTTEGLQVLRFWCVEYYFQVGYKTRYFINEVERQFINEQGERKAFARPKPGMGHDYDAWAYNKPIAIRSTEPRYYGYYGDNVTPRFDLPCAMTVIKSTIPLLRRNGLRKSIHGQWHPVAIIRGLLTKPEVEQLWKMKQYWLASQMVLRGGVAGYMHAVKICTRNRYFVKDPSLWVDYIRILDELGLDTHNAHYVCPKNLMKAHDQKLKMLNNKREREERERRAAEAMERLQRLNKEKIAYPKRWGNMLSVVLTGEDITIRPLQTVDEFAEEGNAMDHCVFMCGYYNAGKNLILSAKDSNGKRLATIEYNVTRGEIVQCRGYRNSEPKRDSEIRNLIISHRKDFVKMQPQLQAAA